MISAPRVSGSVHTKAPPSSANPAASAMPPDIPQRGATAAITTGATNCTPRVRFITIESAEPRTRVGKTSLIIGP